VRSEGKGNRRKKQTTKAPRSRNQAIGRGVTQGNRNKEGKGRDKKKREKVGGAAKPFGLYTHGAEDGTGQPPPTQRCQGVDPLSRKKLTQRGEEGRTKNAKVGV